MSKTKPATCPACKGTDLKQDEDVLDTWFSSWLWPFSTLGWPKQTPDLNYFYPTSTLVTAQEIIFFWVARMVMAGYFCMKEAPFSTVYIHGTVRDITGKKMSKSLGNIIDPLDIIAQYGTDALRYTLVTATAIGQDVFLSEERFTAGRNFANKLWNATRYVLAYDAGGGKAGAPSLADRWILSRLQHTIQRVTKSLEAMLFNDAAAALYDFLWHDFCDWYLEMSKHVEPAQRAQTRATLARVLEAALRLLHPVMPFVTEELWQYLRDAKAGPTIMKAPWPATDAKAVDDEAEAQVERFMQVVTSIRTTRAELNIPPDRRPPVHLVSKDAAVRSFFEGQGALLRALAQVSDVSVAPQAAKQKDAASAVVDGIEILLPLAGLIDAAKETKRLQQRVNELTQYVGRTEARLNDPQFAGKAPAEVVEQARTQLAQSRETLKKLHEYLSVLQSM